MHGTIRDNCVDIQLSAKDLTELKLVLALLKDQSPYYSGTILESLNRIVQRYEAIKAVK